MSQHLQQHCSSLFQINTTLLKVPLQTVAVVKEVKWVALACLRFPFPLALGRGFSHLVLILILLFLLLCCHCLQITFRILPSIVEHLVSNMPLLMLTHTKKWERRYISYICITCMVRPSFLMRSLPSRVHGAGSSSFLLSRYLHTRKPDLPFSGQYFTTWEQ